MHGSSSGTVVINISPMSEKEAENERLKEIARNSEKMTLPKSHDCGCPSDTEIITTPDMVLFESMDFEPESELFSRDKMPRFARAMGMGEDEVRGVQLDMDEAMMMEPKSLSRFKEDYMDLQKFGGDDVAMELSREFEPSDMDDDMMDAMLSTAMDSGPSFDEAGDIISEAKAAMEEQFGRDAMAVMEGEVDGVVSFSIDTPKMGRVRFMYDSSTGESRVMREE